MERGSGSSSQEGEPSVSFIFLMYAGIFTSPPKRRLFGHKHIYSIRPFFFDRVYFASSRSVLV